MKMESWIDRIIDCFPATCLSNLTEEQYKQIEQLIEKELIEFEREHRT